jgi:phosphatidylinositol dimannoside acyltransferase
VSSFGDTVSSVGYGLGWSVVQRLPEPIATAAFRFCADIAWRRQGAGVQLLENNLRRVLGPDATGAQVRAVSRESIRSYARYWLEVFRLPVMPVEGINDRTLPTGEVQVALGHLANGRGVIFALPHMGNWDQAGAWIINQGAGSFTTVMERLKPESLYERFVAFREGLGMEVLPASGGGRPFAILARRLRAGKLVCLPCDRDVTGHGIEVDFFGEKARMAPGPAALAVQTGAALMPVALWFEDDGWGLRVGAEIPVPADGSRKERIAAMTQQLARFFQDGISEHPQDWHMLQRVFTADLDPVRLAAAERKAAAQVAANGTEAGLGYPTEPADSAEPADQAGAAPAPQPPDQPSGPSAPADRRAGG